MQTDRLETRIAHRYSALSSKLQEAADYVIAHPVEIATRSLRSVSAASDVSPATFSRLARALDFENYEELREMSRAAVGARVVSFADKAAELRDTPDNAATILGRQAGACMANIGALVQETDQQHLQDAVTCLNRARKVVLFGAFGSHGMAEYMAYLATYFQQDWRLSSRAGSSLAASLESLTDRDALLVITKSPYARRAVLATRMAQETGASTVVLTDSHACPALAHASFGFTVPSDSPQFFSSYAATLVLMETIIAMMIALSEDDISSRIRIVEERNKRLGEFWAE